MTTKTTIEWFKQLSETSEGIEEKREAMECAFRLACQSAQASPLAAIHARKAMNRAENREEYKAAHGAIRANGE
jgi:hypothetical protein